MSDQHAHWRLAADDRWERVPALPRWGRIVALGDSLVAAMLDPEVAEPQQRLVLFRSVAGEPFQRWKSSAPLNSADLHNAQVVGDRLLAYVITDTPDGVRRLLFEASEEG